MPGGRMWLVTLTVGGEAWAAADVHAALERLAGEHPFLLSGRYGTDRAELRYWEEAEDCGDACALALRLWGEHRASAELPPWGVLGLEVIERTVVDRRSERDGGLPAPMGPLVPVSPHGTWRLME